MKKHYLLSILCLPLCGWWLMNPSIHDSSAPIIALIVVFITYPIIIDKINYELDKEQEE